MNRHRQRDLEANRTGGVGALNTRKRSWKTIDGAIVETRPYAPLAAAPSRERASSSQQQQQPGTSPTQTRQGARVEGEQAIPQPQQHISVGIDRFSGVPAISDEPEDAYTARDSQQQQQPWAADNSSFHNFAALEYDQIFQPDTASSFNMPYTTALDYNWLFNNNLDDTLIRTGAVQETSTLPTDIYGQGVCDPGPFITAPTPPESLDSVADLWVQQQCQQTFEEGNSSTFGSQTNEPSSSPLQSMTPSSGSRVRHGFEAVAHRVSPQTRTRGSQGYAPAATTTTPGPRPPLTPERERPLSMLDRSTRIPQIDQEIRERLINVIEMANPQVPGSSCLVREHLLLSLTSLNTYLELYFTQFNTAYPLLHLPTFDLRTVEPLLLLSALLLGATYLSKEAHQLAVCVHDVIRPSIFAHAGFSARPELWTLQTILLVECFGKSRAGQTQHDMSHLFHGLLINLIRRSDCQSVRPEGPPPLSKRGVDEQQQQKEEEEKSWRRWAQAEQKKRLALVCFMCDTQHAVLFCQSLCMSAFELRVALPCSQSIWEAPDAASWVRSWWRTAAAAAAAVATRGGSEEVLPSPPPVTDSGDDSSIPFLAALKSYLTPQAPRPARLTGLSRVLLLHGLMSVAWDMQRREQTALGVADPSATGGRWRRVISAAYDVWKTDFDAHVRSREAVLPEDGNMGEEEEKEDLAAQRREMDAFAAAYSTVYHAAQALLHMEFLDVQIYAGARHILGRPVQQRDYLRSSQVIRRWAADLWSGNKDSDHNHDNPSNNNNNTRDGGSSCQEQEDDGRDLDPAPAGTAAWHAARLLLEAINHDLLDSSEAMGLFHVPWCLFLATLTCWAVHHARPRRRGGYSESSGSSSNARGIIGLEMDQDDDIVWDPEADMRGLVASMARTRRRDEFLALGKRSTAGLVWVMADELTKVRWGIIHSGVVVLRGLVPQRMINRYEEPL